MVIIAPIMLTGAGGQIGYEVNRLARNRKIPLVSLTRRQLDITNLEKTREVVVRLQPSIIINAAAYTAVDLAEAKKKEAFAGNHEGPANLAAVCNEQAIPLIHISTDYVFDGRKKTPYYEDDLACPASIYGLSKWQGEKAVREQLKYHLIIRTSWVFGTNGHNFVKTILRLGRERDELRIVADQHGCPTYAPHIADTVLAIAKIIRDKKVDQWGTFHYCDQPPTTWQGFAEAIIELALEEGIINRPVAIKPIKTEEYPTPAHRPQNSVLNCSKILNTFGLHPLMWRDGLRDLLKKTARKQ